LAVLNRLSRSFLLSALDIAPVSFPLSRQFRSRLSPGGEEQAMRKSRFTESQIVGILKQGETGIPIAEILRPHNISNATYFHWRSKYAGASVDALKRLKELEVENTKLKRMYAELALENAAIKDVLSRKRWRRPRNEKPWRC
jgi:putative transposase